MDSKKKKITVTFGFTILLILLCITFVNAYYNDTRSINILAALVGDFDSGEGDVNMMWYKEVGTNEYERVYTVPSIGYTFDDTQTDCSITCSNSNSSADCYYHYNQATNSFTLTSNSKVTCKFYFNESAESDINVIILKEDENGTYEYNSKTYSISESVPAYGYTYVNNGYSCDHNSTVTYNSATRTFSVAATQKETCYVYFDDNNQTSDVTVNIYISNNSGTYERVDYIPQNKIYELSQTQTSSCTDANATITYTDGYINISAAQQQTCNVYLDLAS